MRYHRLQDNVFGKGFKVHLIQILNPEERKLQRQGMFTFVDLETQKRVLANAGTIRHAYQRVMRDHTGPR